MLLEQSCRHGHGLTHKEGFEIGILAENGHAFLFELTGKNSVHRGGVTEPILNALDLYGLITDHLHANVVARLIQTEMFKPKQDAHPAGAADAGDRERLAPQIFGSLDVRSDHQIIAVTAVERGDDFEVMSCGNSGQNCAAAGTPDMNTASGHAGDQSRRTADKNGIDI